MDSKRTLRILMVEDLSSDVELAERELKKEGIEYVLQQVDTKEEYLKALNEFQPDIIISDYAMPNFDGMQALQLAKEKCPDIPLIILTGSMNEETAVACMKGGAWDYVIKEHIKRLPFAVKEAVERKLVYSARKETERALLESENLFRTLFNTMFNPALILDFDGTILYGNIAAAIFNKMSAVDDIIGLNVIKFLPSEGIKEYLYDLKLVKEGVSDIRDYRLIMPSGGERWVLVMGAKTTFKGKKAVLVTLADITERKHAEKKLEHERDLLQSLMDNIPDTIYFKDDKSRFTRINKAQAKILGVKSPDDAIGKTDFDFFDSKHAKIAYADEQKLLQSGKPVVNKIEHLHTSEGWRWKSATKVPIRAADGRITGLVGISRDITDLKLIEEALQKRTGELTERIKELHCVYSIAKLIEERDKPSETIFQEAVGLIAKAMQFPEFTNVRITVGVQRYTTDGFTQTERKISSDIFADGEKSGKIEVFYSVEEYQGYEVGFLKDELQLIENIAHHFGSYLEHKRTEGEREKLNTLLKETQAISKMGGWEYDMATGKITWTDEVYRIYGVDKSYDPSDIGHYDPDSAPVLEEAFRRAVENGESYDLELEFIRGDGKHLWVRAIGKPVIENGKQVRVVGNIMDITDRKNLEQQILQAQKLESIGQLAGGIAHDLNNVLGAILGLADLGRRKSVPEEPLYGWLLKIIDLTERGARVTQQLLTFSRQQSVEPVRINLNKSLPDMVKLLRKTLGEHIDIQFNPAPGLWTVNVDPGQIDQVIMNLCINARDAMPDGGELIINTRNVDIDDKNVKHFADAEPGKYVHISVRDSGAGIKPEHIDRIFDPFFTTKEVGKGTGLGLSVVHGIVGKHKGFIDVRSELNKGTIFNVYLPAVDGEPEEVVSSDQRMIPKGTGTILIVEDDESLRNMINALLEQNGYTTITAKDGEDGFDRFMKNRDKIDLVVSDVVMPKASGKDLYERLCAVKPDIRFLFISGYTADIIGQHLMMSEDIDFIPKPFSPHKFGEKIAEMLNR